MDTENTTGGDIAMFITTFQADVAPPIGSPLCGGLVKSALKIVDPLSARGIILFTDEQPIVLCAVDWCGICDESHDLWRDAIAEAAGTTRSRVTVHTLHPHDAPWTNRSLDNYLKKEGVVFREEVHSNDMHFENEVIERVASAVRQSLVSRLPVSHLSVGKASVEKFASNRLILGNDGKVEHWRGSSCGDEHIREMDEGLIDPFVRSIGFWNEDQPLVSLTWYASHPQSFYNRGAVSPDTVGLARGLREATLPSVDHIHFCGAGGNVAAGKYNDGSPVNRFELAGRLATGMEKAWDHAVKIPIHSADVEWKTKTVALPLASHIAENGEAIKAVMNDEAVPVVERMLAAWQLGYKEMQTAGRKVSVSCLKLGSVYLLHLPGEMFVEYQLAAQAMRPDEMVCLAAYGDLGIGYIGTKKAYEQGGYECSAGIAKVAPDVEEVLLDAMRELLD